MKIFMENAMALYAKYEEATKLQKFRSFLEALDSNNDDQANAVALRGLIEGVNLLLEADLEDEENNSGDEIELDKVGTEKPERGAKVDTSYRGMINPLAKASRQIQSITLTDAEREELIASGFIPKAGKDEIFAYIELTAKKLIDNAKHLDPADKEKQEQKAKNILSKLYTPFVLNKLRRNGAYGSTDEDKKDVFQDAMLWIAQSIDKYIKNGNPSAQILNSTLVDSMTRRTIDKLNVDGGITGTSHTSMPWNEDKSLDGVYDNDKLNRHVRWSGRLWSRVPGSGVIPDELKSTRPNDDAVSEYWQPANKISTASEFGNDESGKSRTIEDIGFDSIPTGSISADDENLDEDIEKLIDTMHEFDFDDPDKKSPLPGMKQLRDERINLRDELENMNAALKIASDEEAPLIEKKITRITKGIEKIDKRVQQYNDEIELMKTAFKLREQLDSVMAERTYLIKNAIGTHGWANIPKSLADAEKNMKSQYKELDELKKSDPKKADVLEKRINDYLELGKVNEKHSEIVAEMIDKLPRPSRNNTGAYYSAYKRLAEQLLDKRGIPKEITDKFHPKSAINPEGNGSIRELKIDPRTVKRSDMINELATEYNVPTNVIDAIAATQGKGEMVWKDPELFKKTVADLIPAIDSTLETIAERTGFDIADVKAFAEDKKHLLIGRGNEFIKQLREKLTKSKSNVVTA